MSNLPLPGPLARLLTPVREAQDRPARFAGSLSLYFDKGMDRYGDRWMIAAGDKEEFLAGFAELYRTRSDADFESRSRRRIAVLEGRGAKVLDFTTHSRLAIGLGLSHPIETGFLLDRQTGCPYLPGSSVKGLLRAAAKLVAQGELEGDQGFWSRHLDRVFGPEIDPDTTPRTGEAIFYDAFPAAWPELQVDVLTPHYGDSYRDENVPPADWQNPVPVAFLTVAPNVTFQFPIAAEEGDLQEIEKLLGIALDWLGIGAKKSAGYGVFGTGPVSVPVSAPASKPTTATKRDEPQPPASTQEKRGPSLWNGVELHFRQGSTFIARGGKQTPFSDHDLPAEVYQALRKHRKLKADVEVQKVPSGYRIMAVKSWSIG